MNDMNSTVSSGKTPPAVSIVVTSYNYAHVLRETLDAIAGQTFRDFEVLVVDNGSSDGSPDIVREYASRDSRFRLLQHEGAVNRGLPASVKLGVEASGGEYVAFCEADDVWMPAHLEKCMALVGKSRGKAQFVITELEPFGDSARCAEIESEQRIRMVSLSGKRRRISPPEFRRVNWIFTFSVVMVRRSVLLGCDFLSVPRPSNLDWWLWRQIALEHDVWIVHERLTKWRLHATSFTVKDDTPTMIAEGYDMAARMDRMLVERHPEAARSIIPFLRPEDEFHCENGVLVGPDGKQATNAPFFSVVVFGRGSDDSFRKTGLSLDAQQYGHFETVLVRGGAEEAVAAQTKGEWILFLRAGDVLRETALAALAARAVLDPDADAFYGVALRTGTSRSLGSHSLVGGDVACSDGWLRPFACPGAFAVRAAPSIPPPDASDGGAFPERRMFARLCGAEKPVFVDRILLLCDDGPGGSDPDDENLKRMEASFIRACLPVCRRGVRTKGGIRSAVSTAFSLLRRDGFVFFAKCGHYFFSRAAWKWLFAQIALGQRRNASQRKGTTR